MVHVLHSTEAAGEEGLGGVKVVTLVKESGREGRGGEGEGREGSEGKGRGGEWRGGEGEGREGKGRGVKWKRGRDEVPS